MQIALDAMGTDSAPAVEVAGAVDAIRANDDLRVLLVGDESMLGDSLKEHRPANRIGIIHAPDRITSDDAPASALRRRPRSSIGVGLALQKQGKADAFVSAGPTGAVMAGSLLVLRSMAGVDRPTVGTLLPTSRGPTLLVDSGANIECKPNHLLQFARLGAIYMQDLLGVAHPRIGLLNVGTEPTKGPEMVLEAHRLLAQSNLRFVGNVEGRDIIRHPCDVLVCDGFAGNVLLKFYESVAGFLVDKLRSRLDPERVDASIDEVFRMFDYTEHGGAPLLGVNGVSIICHGGSPPKAISAAIRVAARAVRSGMVGHMARDLASGMRVVV